MADTFELKLLTPQREVFDEPVAQVTAQGALGQFGVLPDHVAFLTSLDPGPLTIRTAGGSEQTLAVKSGYAEVLEAARPKLTPGALVVAHDACVPLFAPDFERFHDVIKHDSGLLGPQILPLDECGVSVSRVA